MKALVKAKAEEADIEVASMDDTTTFGPVAHRLSFGEAIRKNLLSDYRIVVVGIDEERNLFRLSELYHTLRRTTWNQSEPERWLLARPLGAFLFFLKVPPP